MRRILKRWSKPLIRTQVMSGLVRYYKYIRDLYRYSHMEGAEPIRLKDTYPCLFDNIQKLSPGGHYFYQDIWAFKKIYESGVGLHVDVGSRADFVGFLTAVTNVEFVDIRPLDVPYLQNFKNIQGSILDMPYEDGSLMSLSCLHVAEHIGLGRYGDPLDPLGTRKAATELSRCLGVGGNLYIGIPVGRPRLCFNAHRIHSPEQVVDYFHGLKLVEFNLINDRKCYTENADFRTAARAKYACGLFQFTK